MPIYSTQSFFFENVFVYKKVRRIRDDILAICANPKVIHQNHEKDPDYVIQNIKVICEKYHEKHILNDR